MHHSSLKSIHGIVQSLQDIFPNILYAYDFTIEHYVEVLKSLSVFQNEAKFNEKKGVIKSALVQYFLDSGQVIDLEIELHTFSLKKRLIEPERDIKFDRLLYQKFEILNDIFIHQNNYKKLDYLLTIPTEKRRCLFEDFHNEYEARHYLRVLLNNIFKLKPKDIILFLNHKIYIRYFVPIEKNISSEERRFAGESLEVVQALYDKYFPTGGWDSILNVIDDVLEDKLNFSRIDNTTFSKLFIPVFRSMIDVILEDILDESDREKLEGLTGFILRRYFDDILIYTAKNLLAFAVSFDKNAELFIKYYSDEIIIDPHGKRVQKPTIIDCKQQKWNFNSIVSIMMQYKQAMIKIAKQKEAIDAQNERCTLCEEKMKVLVEKRNSLTTKRNEISLSIRINEKSITELHLKNRRFIKNTPEIEAKLGELFKLKKGFLEAENEITFEIESTKNKLINKYHELSRLKKRYEHEKATLEAFKKQSEPIVENYENIAQAIAKVLARR